MREMARQEGESSNELFQFLPIGTVRYGIPGCVLRNCPNAIPAPKGGVRPPCRKRYAHTDQNAADIDSSAGSRPSGALPEQHRPTAGVPAGMTLAPAAESANPADGDSSLAASAGDMDKYPSDDTQ
jgi:hypothetical protein